MSYKPTDLSVLAYANNFTLWHYVTKDLNIQSDGYFNNAVDMLRHNDLLIGTTADTTQIYIVRSSGKHVVVSLFYKSKELEMTNEAGLEFNTTEETKMRTIDYYNILENAFKELKPTHEMMTALNIFSEAARNQFYTHQTLGLGQVTCASAEAAGDILRRIIREEMQVGVKPNE